MGKKLSETAIVTGEVRFSYTHVFAPYAAQPGQEEKYSVCLLIPKTDTKTIKLIEDAVQSATDEGRESKWGGKTPKNLKLPLRDGDEEKDLDTNPEYKGMFFLNASSKRKPGIVDHRGNDIIDSDELKSGDYGKAHINFYPFAVSGNNGIAVGLNNVMKSKDGDSLGGTGLSADKAFEGEFTEGDDADDLI